MRPFFILGCPRSGTTMLQQALNRHPQIAIPPETKFFYSLYRSPVHLQRASLERIRRDLKIDLRLPPRGIGTASEARTLFLEMSRRYSRRVGRHDLVCFGEKTPEHTSRMSDIAEVFPEARYLFLYRDGRDVSLSLSRMPWMTPDPCLGILIWLHYYRILRQLRAVSPPNVMFVRYEDLVVDPPPAFDRILRFLGVDNCEAVAAESGNAEGVPPRELAWKSRALEPITSSRIGTFRKELPASELAAVEALGRDALIDLGYPINHGRPARIGPFRMARLCWSMTRFALRLPRAAMFREIRLWRQRPRLALAYSTAESLAMPPRQEPVAAIFSPAAADPARGMTMSAGVATPLR